MSVENKMTIDVKNKTALKSVKTNAFIFCFLPAGRDAWNDFAFVKVRPKTFFCCCCLVHFSPLSLASCHHPLIDWLLNDFFVPANWFDGKRWTNSFQNDLFWRCGWASGLPIYNCVCAFRYNEHVAKPPKIERVCDLKVSGLKTRTINLRCPWGRPFTLG